MDTTNTTAASGAATLGPLNDRAIKDAIRNAYDLGYNDARTARTVPGDSAPGYKGRDAERDHGGALIHTLSRSLAAPAAQEAEPAFWVRTRSDGGHEGPIPHAAMEEVRKRSGAWTPLYAHPPRPQADARAVPEGWRLMPAPIAPDIAADIERSDWTAKEALRWYAAGKHYDTVPNGDGTSSARILDNGAVASNALKSLSRDYAEHKGDVALQEAAAPQAPAAVPPEQEEVDFLVRVLDTLAEWSSEDWNELFERQPAIAGLVRPLLTSRCNRPPAGWNCSRTPGHDGPCAAAQAPAAGEMLEALQLVASKLESRPYGTGSYIPKPIREKVHAAIARARQEGGGA